MLSTKLHSSWTHIFREARSTSKPRWNGVLSGFAYIISFSHFPSGSRHETCIVGGMAPCSKLRLNECISRRPFQWMWMRTGKFVGMHRLGVYIPPQISFNDALAAGCSQVAVFFQGLPLGPARSQRWPWFLLLVMKDVGKSIR